MRRREFKGRAKRGGRAKGFVSPSRKLTDEQAIEIRFLVASGKLSERAAGRQYDVSPKTIRGIMCGKLYVKPSGKPVKLEPREHGLREKYEPTPPDPWPLPKLRFEFEEPPRSYALAPLRETRESA